jgi:hypothetical protein
MDVGTGPAGASAIETWYLCLQKRTQHHSGLFLDMELVSTSEWEIAVVMTTAAATEITLEAAMAAAL